MKKIIIFLIFVGFLLTPIYFLSAPPRLARVEAGFPNDLPGPKISPDSKLYFLKIWWEKLVLLFTFDPAKKAEEYKIFAEKRAAEGREMLLKGKTGISDKLKEVYTSYLNKAKAALEKAIQKAIDKQKENLKQELEKRLDDILKKIKDSINLW